MASIISVDGSVRKVIPTSGEMFSLEELQEAVGGYIEAIPLKDDKVMFVNEEGKLEGLDYNFLATSLMHNENPYMVKDCVVGNAIVCEAFEVD